MEMNDNMMGDVHGGEVSKRKVIVGSVIGGLAIIFITVMIFLFVGNGEFFVERSFSSGEVAAGEIFTLSYTFNLEEGKQFTVVEDTLPNGFEVMDCKSSDDGRISFLNPEVGSTRSCSLKAPTTTGTYSFSGEYFYEGINSKKISGTSMIVIK